MADSRPAHRLQSEWRAFADPSLSDTSGDLVDPACGIGFFIIYVVFA
jgi:hypothetical protein